MLKTLLALFVCLTVLTAFNGCARKVILHPLDSVDYKEEKDGDVVQWICLTPSYFEEVVKARLGK